MKYHKTIYKNTKKKLSIIVLLTCLAVLQAPSQSGLTISAGSSIFIGSGTIFSTDSLILIPSADFTMNGLNAETRNAVISHPAPQPHILRVFHLSNSLQSFSGLISVYYLDAELNGLAESGLTLNTNNGILWNAYALNVLRDGNKNFVTTSGLLNINIDELTLAAMDEPLPIVFGPTELKCYDGYVKLSWTTEEESNSDKFGIERATDGNNWQIIGELRAAGNSSIIHNYSYNDYTFQENAFYRIVETDLDGRQTISPTINSSCAIVETFNTHPNPVFDNIYIGITVLAADPIKLTLYDDRGSLVRQIQANLIQGDNRIKINLSGLASGIYYLHANWGKNSKTSKILKE